MDMSVAFAIDHRSVADWPRSMLRGSAVKLLIRAADAVGAGGGSGSLVGAGVGAGAVGTGVFFLHPATLIISNIVNTAVPSVLGFSLISIVSPLLSLPSL